MKKIYLKPTIEKTTLIRPFADLCDWSYPGQSGQEDGTPSGPPSGNGGNAPFRFPY